MNAFIECAQRSLAALDAAEIDRLVLELASLRSRHGRLFCIGNGGGHSHASHAASDFRTLCGIEAYSFDNLANLTALANDEGFHNCYQKWLQASGFCDDDLLLVISVGGGDEAKHISENIVNAVSWATSRFTLGICGRDGGYTGKNSAVCVLIPCDRPEWTTPITEGVQSLIAHMIVSDPRLSIKRPKWESADEGRIP